MNKYILLAIPVGVAAGLSLPFLVPVRKPKPIPIPKPATPQVVVEGVELGHRPKPMQPVALPPVSVSTTDSLGSLASEPVYVPPVTPRATRKRHRARKLDAQTMRKIQLEDSRAWQQADRMLMYERRGA